MKNNLEKCIKVPLSKLTTVDGKDLVQIYRDRWWIVDENNNVLFYNGYSPQCNADQSISISIRDKLYIGLEVRLIDIVYIPIRSNDFDFNIN